MAKFVHSSTVMLKQKKKECTCHGDCTQAGGMTRPATLIWTAGTPVDKSGIAVLFIETFELFLCNFHILQSHPVAWIGPHAELIIS